MAQKGWLLLEQFTSLLLYLPSVVFITKCGTKRLVASRAVHFSTTSSSLPSRYLFAGLLIFRGKKSKISRDFQGQIRGKIGRFRGIFAGKKSKFAEKSANFAGFSREKSQISQKNRPISSDFSGKKSNFKGFSGANSRDSISREISGGNFSKKQSVKNGRFHWIFFGKFR